MRGVRQVLGRGSWDEMTERLPSSAEQKAVLSQARARGRRSDSRSRAPQLPARFHSRGWSWGCHPVTNGERRPRAKPLGLSGLGASVPGLALALPRPPPRLSARLQVRGVHSSHRCALMAP